MAIGQQTALMEAPGRQLSTVAAGNRGRRMGRGPRALFGLMLAGLVLAACSPPVSSEPYPAEPGETKHVAVDTPVYADPELTQSCGTTVDASEAPIHEKVDFNSAPDEITTSGSVNTGDIALVTAQTPCDGQNRVWIYLGSRIVPMIRF